MKTRLFALLLIVALLAVGGCRAPQEERIDDGAEPPRLPVEGAPAGPGVKVTPASIVVEQVEVNAQSVTFAGWSTLPDATCLQSELLVDGQALQWWPADTCIKVAGGAWQASVPLPEKGTPGALQPAVDYELRVRQQDAPTNQAVFWFDLSGPRNPEK